MLHPSRRSNPVRFFTTSLVLACLAVPGPASAKPIVFHQAGGSERISHFDFRDDGSPPWLASLTRHLEHLTRLPGKRTVEQAGSARISGASARSAGSGESF